MNLKIVVRNSLTFTALENEVTEDGEDGVPETCRDFYIKSTLNTNTSDTMYFCLAFSFCFFLFVALIWNRTSVEPVYEYYRSLVYVEGISWGSNVKSTPTPELYCSLISVFILYESSSGEGIWGHSRSCGIPDIRLGLFWRYDARYNIPLKGCTLS